MSKEYPTYEEIQRKRKRYNNIAIGAYIAVIMVIVAALTYYVGGL